MRVCVFVCVCACVCVCVCNCIYVQLEESEWLQVQLCGWASVRGGLLATVACRADCEGQAYHTRLCLCVCAAVCACVRACVGMEGS